MSDETLISWTPANWITIILMVVIGFAVLGAVTRMIQNRNSNRG